jgi:hypothetical protein
MEILTRCLRLRFLCAAEREFLKRPIRAHSVSDRAPNAGPINCGMEETEHIDCSALLQLDDSRLTADTQYDDCGKTSSEWHLLPAFVYHPQA